jgi:hypothetical protein
MKLDDKFYILVIIVCAVAIVPGGLFYMDKHPHQQYSAADYNRDTAKCNAAGMQSETYTNKYGDVLGMKCITSTGVKVYPGK